MARKNGCPMNVRNWQVDIESPASTSANPVWIRIKGLESITLSFDSDTEDGSAADSLWSENYITKRSGTLGLEGKPVIDAVTGAQDPGQYYLDYYATLGGCDADTRIRLADPYGRSVILDVIVTGTEKSADDSSESRSWDADIVGAPEEQAYVQVEDVSAKIGGTAATTATLTVGSSPTAVTVVFDPSTASNQKYSVASADPTTVRVSNVDGLSFDIEGLKATPTGGTVDVIIKTMNNSKTETIAVTVTAS